MKNSIKKLPVFILTCLLFCVALLAPLGGGEASAATDAAPTSIDETNALDDLEGSILNGKEFNIEEWGFNERRTPEIVSFVEFGYSVYASRQDDYGLYVYIYNPQGVAFDTDTDRNKIELQAGDTKIARYPMIFLNYSERPGTEGMFYKFKVFLTHSQRLDILNGLVQNARSYRITQVDISLKGDLQLIKCVTTYTYSGYAQGYGSELATDESTLVCKTDGFEDYAELEVHQTVYRRNGDYYEGEQSQVNSCYFRVPEKYYENYGALSKIVCDWYEYVTKPILVTTDGDLYRFFYDLHGGDVPSSNEGKAFAIFHALETDSILWGLMSGYGGNIVTNCVEVEENYSVGLGGMGGYFELYKDLSANGIGFNFRGSGSYEQDEDLLEGYSFNPQNPYSAVFYAEGSYKDTFITANEVEEEFRKLSDQLGGPYLGGRFSEALFSSDIHSGRERGYNHHEIKPNDPVKLFSNYTVKDAWQQFAGGYTLNTEWQNIDAVHEVTEDDLKGSDAEISERLYIGQNDVADLKAEFAKAQVAEGGERVVLLRYADSKYYSIPFLTSGIIDTKEIEQKEIDDEVFDSILWKIYDNEDFNGFISQQTVYLDFKIISLNFLKNGVETVIPVVATPQNVFSPVTPPLEMNFHGQGLPWWFWLILAVVLIVIVIVLVLLFPVLRPIFGAIFKAIWWIITAPFRFIAWVVKKIAEAAKKRREAKAAAPPAEKTPKEITAGKQSADKSVGIGQREQHIILEIRRQQAEKAKVPSKTKTPAEKTPKGNPPAKATEKKVPKAKSKGMSQKSKKSRRKK